MRAIPMSSHKCVCGEPITRAERRGDVLMSSGEDWVHGVVNSRTPSRVTQNRAQRALDRDHAARLA